jgi:transcriptional regulator GlxA family with amidase domain
MSSITSRFENDNRRLLRARDVMDREYWRDLDMIGLGQVATMSRAHFIRSFKEVFGETPYRYLQRRRVERAMYLLRTTDRAVTDICMTVGFSSLGSFSRTFTGIVGVPPSIFRDRGRMPPVPNCFVKSWMRPSTFGEATGAARP